IKVAANILYPFNIVFHKMAEDNAKSEAEPHISFSLDVILGGKGLKMKSRTWNSCDFCSTTWIFSCYYLTFDRKILEASAVSDDSYGRSLTFRCN
ncbi:hypothetical protein ACH5RR_036671, partial [Cinchona calisaya]